MIPMLLLKLTLLFAAAGLMVTLLRARTAATRHFVWLVALTGSLALAVLTPVAPRLPLALPSFVEPQRATVTAAISSAVEPKAKPTSWTALGEVPLRAAAQTVGLATADTHAIASTRPDPWRLAAAALIALWLAGSLVVLLWTALGHFALAGIARDAEPLDARDWRVLLSGTPEAADASAAVRVALSSEVGAPLMWGWPRPAILLPSEARAWPAPRLRDALLHELAHVARGDYLAQSLASFACALYWFHPLAWYAASRLRSECEHACDDRVLAAGTPAPEYAATLLEVARAARSLRVAGGVAVGMARRSHLEGRLLAVLDDTRPRATLPRSARTLTWAVAALAIVPFAGLTPALHAAATRTATAPAEVKVETLGSSKKTSVTTSVTTTEDDNGTGSDQGVEPNAKFERSFAVKPGGTLDLDLKTGGSVEIRAWDQPTVSVLAKLSGRDWSETRVSAEATDGGVSVRSWQASPHGQSYSTSHLFEIRVPARYDVQLQSAGGGITIVGLEGTFRGLSGGGDVTLSHDRGRAFLTTGGGEIQVSDCDLGGNVTTGGGAVRIQRSRGGLVGSSGSGGVRVANGGDSGADNNIDDNDETSVDNLHVSEPSGFASAPRSGADGFVHVAKAGGDVEVEAAPQGAYIMTGGGDVRVGPAAGTVAITTGGGDIEVGPVAGSVWAGTGSGPVTVRLADPHGAKQTVDVSSGTGKVILEVPANLDARFDLESAYTDKFGRATTIVSAWGLRQTRTQDWDDTQGTPRRYVRAQGVAGSGRGLIRVRTVNGDIEVRRVK